MDDYGRRGRLAGLIFASMYLLFLLQPAYGQVVSGQPPLVDALELAAMVVFCAVYIRFFQRVAFQPASRETLVLLAVLYAIASAQTLHYSIWVWSFIYCGAAAAAASSARRGALLPVGAALALTLAVSRLSGIGMDVLPSLLISMLLTIATLLGVGFLVQTNIQLRMAREEVGRLAVAEERLRFARDLHDLLGHSLSVIVLKSELAGRLSATDAERAAAEIRDVERVAREALREVREAVAGYRQLGLSQELESARATLGAAGIDARLQALAGALPTAVDSTLAWALREGVTNILRHSRAGTTEVRVVRSNGQVELELLDDGVGCDGCDDGNGLRGLRERVAARDGTVTAGPRPGGGYRLAVSIPLREAPRTAPAPA